MRTREQKRWRMMAYIVFTVLAAHAILPFALLIIASFTDDKIALINGYSFFPEKLSLDAYRYIVKNSSTFVRAYGITVLVTLVGTFLSVLVTALTAYVLAQRNLPGVKLYGFLVVFTMLFNGGLVATYISYATIFGIRDTFSALLFPNLLMNAFSVMLVRNYFQNNIPDAIFESARIDGASEFLVFRKLVIPLAVPILATVGLMSALAYWNDWQNSLYYIRDKRLYSVQAILNAINDSITMLGALGGAEGASAAELPTTTIRMAIAVVGILPILLIYPFFQKYFAKGLVAGTVKG